MIEEQVDVVPTNCLYCNQRIDAATNITGSERPKDGDITICGFCANILVFQDGQPIASDDIEKIIKEHLVPWQIKALRRAQEMIRKNPPPLV